MYRKDRQNEFYTTLAKKEGYPARSVYKLKEIDEKYKIIREGNRVLDLGCAPGSWLLYISQKVGEKGKAIGVDIEEIKIPQKANIVFIKRSVFDLKESDFKDKFEAVVSDLSSKTSGVKFLDAGKSLELAEKAFEIAKSVLLPGGNFVCKIFQSELSDEFFKKVKNCFDFAKKIRPKAVIKKSKEFYIIGRGFTHQNPAPSREEAGLGGFRT
ncbi:MAG: 50S rRNA methyltransferase [Candidatus Nealsonbacteria bacterium CG_4_10_14_0_8_um_filter_37_14]|uniref:Ribosomal RNA large subunit methyltransferase E n=1 Tax=Candidatus Nealsonbacteria bacterium CG_4_10_14_0_8_um_filter_37_14 TaxID=1974684 RepID=A0A2M7R5T0_9BACT|nr:MAG: 50S rRNA methyltransferase [Candidatus Nealsonbacteria bacterium CG11_big_fil_rev_8_21_14_0_20_37_68]PIY88773.1 MAG: 50S rRNA methyltransferase [Candidatus Nealsonbacteria bacterium CG_4_10_14_0_8_um_filter_37_14]